MTRQQLGMRPVYLDYAAATPLDPLVLKVMTPYFSRQFHNPSALYNAARQVRQTVEAARGRVAAGLGARAGEIVFVSGATEANNLAIQGILEAYPKGHVVFSAVEHESVRQPALRYAHTETSVGKDGRIDEQALQEAVRPNTVLISVMLANNETGTLQPISGLAGLVAEIRHQRHKSGNNTPLFLHTDAAQAPNLLPLKVSRLGIDLMSLNGGKIYGPKQSGILYVRTGTTLQPLFVGGGQERGLRSGTENVPAIIGFAEAFNRAQAACLQESKRLHNLQRLFWDEVQRHIPRAKLNGSFEHRLANNMHLTITGIDNERVVMELDEMGIQCAAGSACSASDELPSHVLKAIGLSDEEAQSSLRFSMGRSTTSAGVLRTVKALAKVVAP